MMWARLVVGSLGIVVWALLPHILSRYMTDLLVFTAIYTIAGIGVGLLLGQCGIVNLGQATFYGIGAYSCAYITVELGYPSIAGFIVGALISMTIALVVGWPVLRLTGYFLALATLALSIIGSSLFYEWDWLTGGELGIGGIPKLDILGFRLDTPGRYYYLAWSVAFLSMVLVGNLITSRTGVMLRAMRDSSDAAASLGIDMQWLRTRVFILSALLGSVAGSLFAHYVSFTSVQSFTVDKSIGFLLIPVLGGVRSLWGVVLGALFVTVMPEVLSRIGDVHQILFGLSLVAVVVLLPDGLVGLLATAGRRLARSRVRA
jgi:branched-chain amino acid transport system permease protein